VLRFNFRGVGQSKGTFDAGAGEKEDFAAALDYMAAKYPGLPLWAAGFSFGSWIALETGAADPRVTALIGIAPPVTKMGYDFANTRVSTKPKFFVQGESDDICPIEDMWKFYGALPEPKELVVIDMADHLFDGHTTEVGEALEDLLKDFHG
jgi:alpha/beta superfamily hydrolase